MRARHAHVAERGCPCVRVVIAPGEESRRHADPRLVADHRLHDPTVSFVDRLGGEPGEQGGEVGGNGLGIATAERGDEGPQRLGVVIAEGRGGHGSLLHRRERSTTSFG